MQHSLSHRLGCYASSGLLLRQYDGAAAAYSLQKLGSYTDNVVRVRRSTDNTESDFGDAAVTGGELREFALNNDSDIIRFADQAAAADKRMYFDGTSGKYISFSTFSNVAFYGCDVTFYNYNTINSSTPAQALLNFDNSGSTFADIAFGASTGVWADEVITITMPGGARVAVRGISISPGVHTLSIRWNSGSGTFDITLDGVLQSVSTSGVPSAFTAPILQVGGSRPFYGAQFQGLIYDVTLVDSNLDPFLTVNGYGNANADWEDQVGSNDGTVNGSPALFSGQGFNAYVTTLYDQSGNSRNATQATAASQPQIVADGVVVTDANGNAAFDYDGTDDHFNFSTSITGSDWYQSTVFTRVAGTDQPTMGANASGPENGTFWFTNNIIYQSFEASGFNQSSANTTSGVLVTTSQEVSGVDSLHVNGSVIALSGAGSPTGDPTMLYVGRRLSNYFDGKMNEMVIYTSDQSANRAAIEANIATRYGITI